MIELNLSEQFISPGKQIKLSDPSNFTNNSHYITISEVEEDEHESEALPIPDFPAMYDNTVKSLDKLEKLKLLFTFMNYFTKMWAIYLVFRN